MNKLIGPIIFSVATAVIVVALAASNTTAIKLSLFGNDMDFAPGYLALSTYILGAVSVLSFAMVRATKKIASGQIEKEWEKQDAKLSNEIQSDREKQLEAKIVTLETALKSALSRNKS